MENDRQARISHPGKSLSLLLIALFLSALPSFCSASNIEESLSAAAQEAPSQSRTESMKEASDRPWGEALAQAPAVAAGASSKAITPFTDGKPWGEPFKPSHPSGHYILGDKCEDLNQDGICSQTWFGGYTRLEKPSPLNILKWFGRGVRRDPVLYNTPDGVHDDIYARAKVLKIAGAKIGHVVVDSVGLHFSDTEAIRDEVKDLGFDLVIVQATHNHAGPDTLGIFGPVYTRAVPIALFQRLFGVSVLRGINGRNPRFMSYIYKQAGAALREADQNARPARLYLSKAPAPKYEGKSIVVDRRPPYIFDPDVHVLQARDLQDRPIVTMANFAVHPELWHTKITELSADISGSIASHIEKMGGGVGIHSNGAIGAMISYGDVYDFNDKKLSAQEKLALREKGIETIGRIVAQTALDSASKSGPASISKVGIIKRKIFIPVDNRLLENASKQKMIDRPRFTNGIPDPEGQDVMTELDLVVLHGPDGKPLAEIFTIPGELAPENYLGGFFKPEEAPNPDAPENPVIKDHLRAPHQYLLGLGNDELSYILPLNDFVFPSRLEAVLPGKDRFGRKHYEETVAASSQMSWIISLNLIGMLQEYYEGRTDLTLEEVARRSRKAALQAFAGRPRSEYALTKLYLHEPVDDATEQAKKVLLNMHPYRAASELRRMKPSSEVQRRLKNDLLRELEAREKRIEGGRY